MPSWDEFRDCVLRVIRALLNGDYYTYHKLTSQYFSVWLTEQEFNFLKQLPSNYVIVDYHVDDPYMRICVLLKPRTTYDGGGGRILAFYFEPKSNSCFLWLSHLVNVDVLPTRSHSISTLLGFDTECTIDCTIQLQRGKKTIVRLLGDLTVALMPYDLSKLPYFFVIDCLINVLLASKCKVIPTSFGLSFKCPGYPPPFDDCLKLAERFGCTASVRPIRPPIRGVRDVKVEVTCQNNENLIQLFMSWASSVSVENIQLLDYKLYGLFARHVFQDVYIVLKSPFVVYHKRFGVKWVNIEVPCIMSAIPSLNALRLLSI